MPQSFAQGQQRRAIFGAQAFKLFEADSFLDPEMIAGGAPEAF